jgi:hypothetical protein
MVNYIESSVLYFPLRTYIAKAIGLHYGTIKLLTLSSACGFCFETINFVKLLQKRSAFILSLGYSAHLFSYVALPRFLSHLLCFQKSYCSMKIWEGVSLDLDQYIVLSIRLLYIWILTYEFWLKIHSFHKNEVILVIQVHVFTLSTKVPFHFDDWFERTVDLNFHIQILIQKS